MRKDWKVLEGVVSAIERATHGSDVRILRRAMLPGLGGLRKQREIDVLVEFTIGERVYRTAIEVKDVKRPLTIEQIEQLISKFDDLDLQARCVVCASGFTEAALDKAGRHRISCLDISPVGMPDWAKLTHFGSIERICRNISAVLRFRVEDAVSTSGIPPTQYGDLILVSGEESPVTIRQFVANNGLQVMRGLPEEVVFDGSRFKARIMMSKLSENSYLRYGKKKLPVPQTIDAEYRIEVSVENIPILSFRRSDGRGAITAISSKGQQFTVAEKDVTEEGRRFQVSVRDLNAPKQKVPPHPDRRGR